MPGGGQMKKVGIDYLIARRVRAIALAAVMVVGVVGGFIRVAQALDITSVNPERGPIEGGQIITITGTNFESGFAWKQVSAGTYYTCAIASDNQAYCWGSNGSGQLGDNTTTNRRTPVAVDTSGVLSGKTILSISTGDDYICAIASDNQAYCWGGQRLRSAR